MDGAGRRFWEEKSLAEMTREEWELVCDGCGRCCLIKLEDEDTGEIFLTSVGCKLLDNQTCRCKDYPRRHTKVPDCLVFDAEKVRQIPWLPQSCSYRRLSDGRGLAWWHHLISGSPDTVHTAGISPRGAIRSESRVKEENYHRYIIEEREEA